MISPQVFEENFLALCALYEREPTAPLAKMYRMALSDLNDQQFTEAIHKVIRSHEYNTLPKPADILQAIMGQDEDRAYMALEEVKEAMRKYGSYSSPRFSDPVIGEVLSRWEGGWVGWCGQTNDELVWGVKDFIRMYRMFAKRDCGQPQRLVGRHEHDNNMAGYIEEGQKYHVDVDNTTAPAIERKPAPKQVTGDMKRITADDIQELMDISTGKKRPQTHEDAPQSQNEVI